MLAEVFYCSFRCLRLVKNILSKWSLGILSQNGDTGQDSEETEQCFTSWDPLKRIWGHWRTVSHNQHFYKLLLPKKNHCIICKDTLALNKIRVISSYSAQVGSNQCATLTHTALMKAHVMFMKGKCFDASCPLQREMKCIMKCSSQITALVMVSHP